MSDLSNPNSRPDSKIDELFRKQQGDWDKAPDASTWHGLSDRLDQHQANGSGRRRRVIRLSVAASLALLIAITFVSINRFNIDNGFQAHTIQLEVPEYDGKEYEVNDRGDMTSIVPADDYRSKADVPPTQSRTNDRNKVVTEDRVDETAAVERSPETEEVEAPVDIKARSVIPGYEALADANLEEEEVVVEEHTYVSEESVQGTGDKANPEEVDRLAEVAVANSEGIEAKQRDRNTNKKRATESAQTDASPDISGTDVFVSETIIIRIPVNDKRCPARSYWLDGDIFYVDPCALSAGEVMKVNGRSMTEASVLQRVIDLGADGLRAWVRQSEQDGCGLHAEHIEISFRRGTPLSYTDEQIRIPIADCIDRELRSLVDELIELSTNY